MKFHQVWAEFHADRRTDMAKLTVAFRNFSNTLKNWEMEGSDEDNRSKEKRNSKYYKKNRQRGEKKAIC
jgi:hypothetical protein